MRSTWITAVLVVIAVLAGCGGSSDARFAADGAPVEFRYPKTLTELPNSGRQIKGRDPVFTTTVGIDDANAIVVATYAIKRAAESYEPAVFEEFVGAAVRAIARAGNQRIAKSDRGKLAGLDAFIYELQGDGPATTHVLAFKGRTQYFVRCQTDVGHEQEIADACTRVRETLKIR